MTPRCPANMNSHGRRRVRQVPKRPSGFGVDSWIRHMAAATVEYALPNALFRRLAGGVSCFFQPGRPRCFNKLAASCACLMHQTGPSAPKGALSSGSDSTSSTLSSCYCSPQTSQQASCARTCTVRFCTDSRWPGGHCGEVSVHILSVRKGERQSKNLHHIFVLGFILLRKQSKEILVLD
jgi:hypothetical protein